MQTWAAIIVAAARDIAIATLRCLDKLEMT